MNEYYSVFGIRKFFMNEYYLVFGIRKFFMNEYIRYSKSFHERILFGIWYLEILHERIYSVFGIWKFFMNEYYSVFGIQKFFMDEYIRYLVFGQIHYSVQLWNIVSQNIVCQTMEVTTLPVRRVLFRTKNFNGGYSHWPLYRSHM